MRAWRAWTGFPALRERSITTETRRLPRATRNSLRSKTEVLDALVVPGEDSEALLESHGRATRLRSAITYAVAALGVRERLTVESRRLVVSERRRRVSVNRDRRALSFALTHWEEIVLTLGHLLASCSCVMGDAQSYPRTTMGRRPSGMPIALRCAR